MSSNGNDFPQLPPLNVRRVVIATLVVAAVIFAFWLLFRFHQVLLILFVAIVISTAIKPIVERLHHYGLPRSAGIILVYLLMLSLTAVFLLRGVPLITSQTSRISTSLSDVYTQVREGMMTTPNLLILRLGIELPESLPLMLTAPTAVPDTVDTAEAADTLNQALLLAEAVATAIFGLIATFVLAFYWTLDGERTKQSLLLVFPMDSRQNVRDLIAQIEQKVGDFVVGQVILVVAVGTLSLIAYLLLGLPYAFVLALFAGLMEAIPVIGPIIAAVPAIILGLSISNTTALWVVLASILIQQLENNLLVPRIMNRAVGVNPLVTLLALIALSSLFGVTGALVAIPIAAIVQIILDRYVLGLSSLEQETDEGRGHLSVLRYQTQELLQDLRKHVRFKEEVTSADNDSMEDSLEAIAADLDSLLAQQTSGETAT